MNARKAGLLIVAATLLLGGCSDRKLRPLNPCTVTGVVRKVSAGGSENVDLLFMIDNSGSMAGEQALLEGQLPNIARALTTGDIEGDMVEDFKPVASLRVGVISSDMGVLGMGSVASPLGPTSSAIVSCGAYTDGTAYNADEALFGDNGAIQLVTPAGSSQPNCEPTYPTFLQFENMPGVDQTAERLAFTEDVACTAVLGTGGCGFEMQLESVLTAVTDPARPGAPTFAPAGRTGQAGTGGANDGFFRDGSVIGIILVTDEEDCSTDNPEMFMFSPSESNLQDPNHDGIPDSNDLRINTRCTFFDEELYPISRYVDGLRALRPDAPDKIVFAGIIGMPPEFDNDDPNNTPTDFQAILNDSRMAYNDRLDPPGDPTGVLLDRGQDPFIEPACWRCESDPSVTTDYTACPDPGVDPNRPSANEGLQWAAPGRRYVELARDLEAAGMGAVVRSICTDDFGPAVRSILERIGAVLKGACLPRALNPDASGAVNCDVVEILPVGMTCAERVGAGREATPIRTETTEGGQTREVCRITQFVPTETERNGGLAPSAGTGWFYDNYSNELDSQDCPAEPDAPFGQRIGFTNDLALPVAGSDIRLECLQPVQGSGLTGPDIFQPCTVDTECHFTNDATGVEQANEFVFRYNLESRGVVVDNQVALQPMVCDDATRTCQITCAFASDCPGGYVCVGATAGVDCTTNECFCVNPTCNVTSSASSGGGGTGGGTGGTGGGSGGGTGAPDAG